MASLPFYAWRQLHNILEMESMAGVCSCHGHQKNRDIRGCLVTL